MIDFDPNENLDADENLDAVWEQRHRRFDLIRRNHEYLRALTEERDEKHASGGFPCKG